MRRDHSDRGPIVSGGSRRTGAQPVDSASDCCSNAIPANKTKKLVKVGLVHYQLVTLLPIVNDDAVGQNLARLSYAKAGASALGQISNVLVLVKDFDQVYDSSL